VTGYGADKTMAAVISGEAQIGFMGAEASVYAYLEGANDPVINFAQGTQRAGNFLVAREEMADFQWSDLKGKEVLGGRKGGMPEMVFEYILKENGLDPAKDLSIDQSIDFGSTAAAFSGGKGEFTVEFEPAATTLEKNGDGFVVASRLCALYFLQRKEQLRRKTSGDHPGVYRRSAKRSGLCEFPHGGGDREGDSATV